MRNNYVTYIVAMRPYLSQLRQFKWLLCAATMSSPAQLLVMPTESLGQQRMAARRALEWIGASKAQLVFRYEISELFPHFWVHNQQINIYIGIPLGLLCIIQVVSQDSI